MTEQRRPPPIASSLAVGARHGLEPVAYLGAVASAYAWRGESSTRGHEDGCVSKSSARAPETIERHHSEEEYLHLLRCA